MRPTTPTTTTDSRQAEITHHGGAVRRLTPYELGERDALAGLPGPAIPKGDATWTEKLYNRGWMDGRDQRNAVHRSPEKTPELRNDAT